MRYVMILLTLLIVTVTPVHSSDFSQMEQQLVEETHIDPMEPSGFKEDSSWTFWNKFWFSGTIVGNTLDVVSTVNALDRGCVELNPILGDNPSTGSLILLKVAVLGGTWVLIEYVVKPENRQVTRNVVYGMQTIIMNAIAVRNFNIGCE